MSSDRIFDQNRFEELLSLGNHLGAWTLVKTAQLNRTEEGIQIGRLANSLVDEIAKARMGDNREKQAFCRSLLAYMLKDWPGLASLYREQIRPGIPGFVPENLQDVWQDFSDVLSGRKTIDESLRQRMEEAGQKAREYGVDVDPLRDFAKDAEKEFRRGAEEVRDFFKGIFNPGPFTKDQDGANGKAESAKAGETEKKQSDTDGPAIKVKIQDADDPLPKDIHQAQPADQEK
jgi:hypothetical protein